MAAAAVPSGVGDPTAPPAGPPVTASQLEHYLRPIATCTVGIGERDAQEAFREDKGDAGDKAVERFLADSNSPGMLFLFTDPEAGKVRVSSDPRRVVMTGSHGVLALVKQTPEVPLDSTKHISTQTSLLVVPPGSPFDPFLRVIQTFEPLLSASIESKAKDRREREEVMRSVEELLGNLTDQSSMKIPQVDLDKHIHEAIRDKTQLYADSSPVQICDKLVLEKQGVDKQWDAEFISACYRQFQQCSKDVKSVVEMEGKKKVSVVANAREEIKFWNDLYDSLVELQRQLNSRGWQVQLDVLKRSNRIFLSGTAGFEHDIGLRNCLSIVKEYQLLFQDLPLSQLHQARNTDQLNTAAKAFYSYLMTQIKPQMKYPIPRLVNLIDAATRDFNKQLLKILSSGLLDMSFEVFEAELAGTSDLFTSWTTGYRKANEQAKSIARKQAGSSRHMAERLTLDHIPLKNRLDNVTSFRRAHQKFVTVLKEVMPSGEGDAGAGGLSGLDALDEMQSAYDTVRTTIGNRVLDVSEDGIILWERAQKIYEEKVDKVEQRITQKLRDRLNSAQTASEMFRVFSKFNPLTSRVKIRSAIQQYQANLIQKVKQDMDALKDKFTAKYEASEARCMSRVRNLPKVSSHIIWAKAIERQLQTYMKRVEDVYGRGWDRLRSLRKKSDGTQASGYWILDDHLAEFVGVKQGMLEKKAREALSSAWMRMGENVPQTNSIKELELRVIGTAIAIAFLEVVFADCRMDWQTIFDEGSDSLKKMEKQLHVEGTYQAVKHLLQDIGVATQHMEGSHLRSEGEAFRSKINENITRLMQRWNDQMRKLIRTEWNIFVFTEKEPDEDASVPVPVNTKTPHSVFLAGAGGREKVHVQGPIFKVVAGVEGEHLEVNFNPEIAQFLKDVFATLWLQTTKWLAYDVGLTAYAARDSYPHAMALWESVKMFQRDVKTVDKARVQLLAKETSDVYRLINQGMRLNWEQELELNKVSKYAKLLHDAVSTYHRRLEQLNKKFIDVEKAVDLLDKCDPNPEQFSKCLDDIQKVLDELNLEKFANVNIWVKSLDEKIVAILSKRLADILRHWGQEFSRLGDQTETAEINQDGDQDEDDKPKKKKRKKVHFNMAPVEVSIKIHNRCMVLDPSIDLARLEWTQRLQKVLGWIVCLPRLQASRFDDAVTMNEHVGLPPDMTYSQVLEDVESTLVYQCFSAIDKRCEEAFKYFEDWMKFQALWEMELDRIFVLCGEELDKWLSLLGDIRQSKNMMDSSETHKSFGAITVCYQKVQEKVAKKYDETNRKLLDKFMGILGAKMKGFYDNVHEERQVLEKMDFTADAQNMVRFLTRLPAIRKKHPIWEKECQMLGYGERVLRKQIRQDQFPQNWLWMERINGEWAAFNTALEKREKEVREKRDLLQKYVMEQDKETDAKFQDLKKEWNAKKPVQGAQPGESIDIVSIFEGQANALKEQFEEICKAKEALNMEVRDFGKMNALTDDIETLRDVWTQLDAVYKDIEKMGAQLFREVNARTIGGQLRELESRLKNFPSSMRTFTAFADLADKIDGLIKINPIIGDLSGPAIKDRHWSQITSLIHADGFENTATLTLGKVWACDLVKFQKKFQDVIKQAQGEMSLENFLAQVRKCWQELELELVDYQKKCWLIKGWDSISEKLSEHINSLQTMANSPYFKAFEDEGTSWEQKLSKMENLFGVPEGHWFEVQRRWVYLEGIFIGNADIKMQLPNETQAFMRVDTDFKSLMQKVKKSPFILEAFGIPGVSDKLGGLLRSLQQIQKALGDYLESQRRNFPRFYFVGDEDLLEIIGHAKEPAAVQKHFKKMFAGICLLDIDEEGSHPIIKGMSSFEEEQVSFKSHIDLQKVPGVKDWLKAVEESMQEALTIEGVKASKGIAQISKNPGENLSKWIDMYASQLLELAMSTEWTRLVEEQLKGLQGKANLLAVKEVCVNLLSSLAGMVLHVSDPIRRKKIEHLITSIVYQRDAVGRLHAKGTTDVHDFDWLVLMRFYNRQGSNGRESCFAEIANAVLPYSYEYLGVGERLVQTPLTDKCYLTLTQALHTRMGGAPSGPAGTGKTETVKALGTRLARFVLVFCCDEAFDNQAMSRIFVGLCQVGAWGCFDEFNRLEEKILSSVSQQIQIIQVGLGANKSQITLLDREVPLHNNVGLFITMNPGYAGRSELPDNLKQLFRAVAMSAPDREIIAEVMLFSQGFQQAEALAKKIVPLFQLCKDQLSQQGHYDFGLRALKSTLVNAGNMKREEKGTAVLTPEEENYILLKSTTKTIEPKLVAEDVALFHSLTADVFPGTEVPPEAVGDLIKALQKVCAEMNLVCKENALWLHKVLQLHQIQAIHHGLMLVGPSCSGKTMAWTSLLIAMSRLHGKEGVAHVIDPKALNKSELYGNLDPTTRDWSDGVFTACLRRIVDNTTGDEHKKIHWIIFDGDVDPEWVENLNALLDDNRLLTLPNGERLTLPRNVKIIFEVQDLKYATLATVSRCGMVWFSEDVCTIDMALHHYINSIQSKRLEHLIRPHDPLTSTKMYEKNLKSQADTEATAAQAGEDELEVQKEFAGVIKKAFVENGLVHRALVCAEEILRDHTIMEWNSHQYLGGLYSMVNKGIQDVIEYNANHPPEFPVLPETLERYAARRLLMAVPWNFAGACNFAKRMEFCAKFNDIARDCGFGSHLPPGEIMDYDVVLDEDGEWAPWDRNVQQVDIPAHKVGKNDVIIPTVDTVRHEEVVQSWLQAHRPMIFCGPPGSGKTMTLTGVLKRLTDYEARFLNFSSGSSPDMILKTFDHPSFQYTTAPGIGPVLRPATPGKWIVVFCDECNLPAEDSYGTQRVISMLRQLIERGGFYRPNQNGEMTWVTLQRVQFAGACNPPTDPGRVPLTHRFLRWAPLLFVDAPSKPSLEAIYGTFCRAFLKPLPQLRQLGDQLAAAMVQFYLANGKHFTAEMQSHYVYSARELSRWTRAVHEGIESLSFPAKQALKVDELVRLSIHEGLRLFRDRLVVDAEKEWCDEQIDQAFRDHFPEMDPSVACRRPILYSTFLSKEYIGNEQEELRAHIQGKLRVFAEEAMDVQLVVFDSVLDHILRIDRIIRQPLGHMLLVGVAGAGKTVLSKFVAWHAGMEIFQIKAHRGYTIVDFEEDLRVVLKRAGCKGEKICFIFDESNVMDSGFLEYMNALLASGEVPGLFEGQEYEQLITVAREGYNALPGAKTLDTSDKHAMYNWFVGQVQVNLHVVFTMNPSSPDFKSRCQTSPALFNRCTIDWFGEWSDAALEQVAQEYTSTLDIMSSQDQENPAFKTQEEAQGALVQSIVKIHHYVNNINDTLKRKGAGRGTYITPRHYLDFIGQFKLLYKEKRGGVLDQQMHLNNGLQKLEETTNEVNLLKKELEKKEVHLREVQKQQHESMERLKVDQVKANEEQGKAAEMEVGLAKEQVEIDEQTQKAEADLAGAKPALERAQKLVLSIPEGEIKEVKAYATPPETVRKVMEVVTTLLGKKAKDWKGVKEVMNREGFLKDLANFDSKKITKRAIDEVEKYLQDPKLTTTSVYKASKACGPLFDWSTAQMDYAKILTRIEPLTRHIAELNARKEATETGLAETKARIVELEKSVAEMEMEFSRKTAEAEQLKIQMKDTQEKCERAEKLVLSLSSEQQRWSEESSSFSSQITTVVGDCLLSGGFLAYNGYFDDHYRRSVILPKWMRALTDRKIAFKKHLSLQDYLSTTDDRLDWQTNGLPPDELYVENAIILKRFQRYPLIIDPSGMAVSFVMTQFKDKKIAKTSFLEDGFMKTLETSIRFGYPLLVQDVECIDPIMNPILNKEVSKEGGFSRIRLGDKDIDLSPGFKLILSTRDPTFQFAPDICGRVSFANFTVTPGSLTSQCLHTTLKIERPDIEVKRSEIMKAQGEYMLLQRKLEQQLLEEINKAQGNILENDALIKQLENIKKTATDVKEKLESADETMAEIKKVEKQFRAVADGCSKLYFMLQQLPDLNTLYQYSLGHFMGIVVDVIEDKEAILPKDNATGDTSDERRDMILRQLFSVTYDRVSRGMLQADHLTLGLRLCQVRLNLTPADAELVTQEMWDLLVSTGQARVASVVSAPDGLEAKQMNLLNELCSLKSMEDVKESIGSNRTAWGKLLKADDPVAAIPPLSPVMHPITKAMKDMLVLKVFRPDALSVAARRLIKEVFDKYKVSNTPQTILAVGEPSLASIATAADAFTPMVLCSAPGFDASDRVQDLAKQQKKRLQEIAMGSPEGYQDADNALYYGLNEGDWLLLKNVHLSAQYLSNLEKKLHAAQLEKKSNPTFRLFLTSEISNKLPSNLLIRSHVLVFEPSNGMQPSLLRSIDKHKNREATVGVTKGPKELPRLHFLAAWLHATIIERLRYSPLGWAKKYEFSESDFIRTVDTIDQWVVKVADGRANLPPNQLPWKALFTLIGESVYGGRVDNDFDQMLMRSFLSKFFVEKCYGHDFALTNEREGEKSLLISNGNEKHEFEKWVGEMPDAQTPVWLGLPLESQKMIQQQQGEKMLIDLVKITDLFGEEDSAEPEQGADGNAPASPRKEGTFIPEWAKRLSATISAWMEELVEIEEHKFHQKLVRPTEQGERPDPIVQALKREVSMAKRLHKQVNKDMTSVIRVCQGEDKPTNDVRDLMSLLSKGNIPPKWRKYTVPPMMTAGQWVADFGRRCRHLNVIGVVAPSEYCGFEVNLGLLLFPGAFLTATRQFVARLLKYPLEKLRMSLDITQDAHGKQHDDSGGSFIIGGLVLQSGQLNNGRIELLQGKLAAPMGVHRLWWRTIDVHAAPKNAVTLPLYLNPSRTELLAKLELPVDPNVQAHDWYQLGTALTAGNPV